MASPIIIKKSVIVRETRTPPTPIVMATLVYSSRNLLFSSKLRLKLIQPVRTGVSFIKIAQTKKYYNADRLENGTEVQAILQAMAARGFCRPRKPYTPPDNVKKQLMEIFEKHLPQADLSQLEKVHLKPPIKFEILSACVRELRHDIPNYELANLRTLQDVVNHYSQTVTGLNPYDMLVAQRDKLPENLHVIPDAHRFHPDRDTMFKGVSAYPGSGTRVTGLRTRRKYDGYRADREWPYEIHTGKV